MDMSELSDVNKKPPSVYLVNEYENLVAGRRLISQYDIIMQFPCHIL